MPSLGHLSCRVLTLNGEYYRYWKGEVLDIFNESIDPLHPYHDDEVNILGNVKTINLIIRGLPRNVLNHMKNFECAYTLWKDLEKRYLDYSLKPLDIIF